MIREWSCDSPRTWPDLELLEAQHLGAGAPREPVGRRAPEAAQPEDDVLVVELHR